MYLGAIENVGGVYHSQIWKNVAGVWTKLSDVTLASNFNASGALKLSFKVFGSTLQLSVFNNTTSAFVLQNNVTDSTPALATGIVGIRNVKDSGASAFGVTSP